jgi:3'-phosphoadenosine 5'-phosphosulfate sulfotransferase (PAPS reductase)/FAD synthetase
VINIDNKHTASDLKEMQSWSLDRKIRVTQTRIIEWYEHYNGKVYISFSGGKDSTVLLDLARRIYPDIEAVFVDTGLEYPEIREFVKTKENITWLKPKMSFKKVIDTYGYPVISKAVSRNVGDIKKLGDNCFANKLFNGDYGAKSKYNMTKWKFLIDSPFKISNKCCDIMKKYPLKQHGKTFHNYAITATMACESMQRKQNWLNSGCNAFDNKTPISQPMSFWTEQDVLKYLRDFNISYCSVYGNIIEKNKKLFTTGLDRTGCMFCMFGCHLEKEPNRFQRMKITHPKQYDYCIRSVEENGLGLGQVLDFIGVKY